MISKRRLHILLLVLTTMACQPKQPKEVSKPVPSNKDSSTTSQSTQKKEAVPEIFEEAMMDDIEFMPPIESNSYFGIAVGDSLTQHTKMLHSGSLKSGEGVFPVHYMLWNKDTLGYTFGEDIIRSIHIWDGRGSTYEGIRVGSTFAEIKRFLKNSVVHGSEVESRVHVSHGQHLYRLDFYDPNYTIDIGRIPDSVRVMEIVISKN